eukprot:760478-Hanusia_phi.AAC.1
MRDSARLAPDHKPLPQRHARAAGPADVAGSARREGARGGGARGQEVLVVEPVALVPAQRPQVVADKVARTRADPQDLVGGAEARGAGSVSMRPEQGARGSGAGRGRGCSVCEQEGVDDAGKEADDARRAPGGGPEEEMAERVGREEAGEIRSVDELEESDLAGVSSAPPR